MSDNCSAKGVIVITGATGGMGQPTALRLARRGLPLILNDLPGDRLEALAAELRAEGSHVTTIGIDMAAPEFAEQLIASLDGQEIAALVHTAGLSPTMGDAERIIEVNYFAVERLLKATCPHMAARGCAVLMSSISAYMVMQPDTLAAVAALVDGGGRDAIAPWLQSPRGAYPISKLAIIRLVAREAHRFGARNARIVSIAPGFIDTAMGRAEAAGSEQMRAMMERVSLQRLGQGDDIASVVEFLCSEQAGYITGCDIKVDGGALAELGL